LFIDVFVADSIMSQKENRNFDDIIHIRADLYHWSHSRLKI